MSIIFLIAALFGIPCIQDSDCSDGMFCTGVEKCVNNICEEASYPCVDLSCNENSNNCTISQRNANGSLWHFSYGLANEYQLFIDTNTNINDGYNGFDLVVRGTHNDFGALRFASPGIDGNPGGWGTLIGWCPNINYNNNAKFIIPTGYNIVRWQLEFYQDGRIISTRTGNAVVLNNLLNLSLDFVGQ